MPLALRLASAPDTAQSAARQARAPGRFRPVQVHSPLVGIDWFAPQGAALRLPLRPDFEYGVMPLTGSANVQGQAVAADELLDLPPGAAELALDLPAGTRALLVGGEPLGEDITLWWNFVGHRQEHIAQAHADWLAGSARFGNVPGFDGPPLQAPPLPWTVSDAMDNGASSGV